MKFKIENNLTQNVYSILRETGYMPLHDRLTGKNSYARKLSSNRYPRFHLYLQENPQEIIFDLHLDQNINSYEGQTAHNADYDSDEVRQELIRIFGFVRKYLSSKKV